MTDDPLSNLISAAEACVASAKGSLDAVVSRLRAIQTDGIKADADLADKLAHADQLISNRRADLQHLAGEIAKKKRELELVQRDITKGEKRITDLTAEYQRTVDRILSPAA